MTSAQGLPKGSDLFVEAFAKGLAVIRAFGPGHRELTLSEVAVRAGVPPAGARRLLHTLVTLGYVRVNGRTFSLLPSVLDLGYSYLSSLSLREVAEPLLEAFARECGEVCTVSVLDRTDVVFVARAEMRSPISRRLVSGERLPAHATSSGHVLLAALPAEDLKNYVAQAPFERLTQHTVTQAGPLLELLEQVRTRGYSMASEHLELGVCGLAVPLKDRAGHVVAALTTSLSLARHDLESVVPAFLPRLERLSAEIGAGLPI